MVAPVERVGLGIVNTIQGITPPSWSEQSRRTDETASGESVFASIFKSAIQDVKDTDAEFVEAQYLLATGQLDNPAQVNLAAYKNEIAVDLLIQLRNKALDAYNELKNMNI